MKKIIVLLVGLLAMFSCEQEDLEGIVKSDTGQVQTRATASIADFDPISELANIPVNILNVGNTSLRYLSCARKGYKVDIFTKDDGSLRQRWYLKENNIVSVGGNETYKSDYNSSNVLVMIGYDRDNPKLVGQVKPSMPSFYSCYNRLIPAYGNYYYIGSPNLMYPNWPSNPDYKYLQSDTYNRSDLKYKQSNSTNLALWEIVAVGEYEIVNLEYVYTSTDNLTPTEVVYDVDTYENPSSSVVTWDYSLSIDVTETSNFSKTEGVSTSISNGLSVGLPNLLGEGSSIGVNTTIQQQSSKSWTYGNSDTKKITRTRTVHIPVQPHSAVGLQAVVFMYEGTVTYVATLRKIGDTRTFKVKGKWEGACCSSFKAKTYDVATKKLMNTYSLD